MQDVEEERDFWDGIPVDGRTRARVGARSHTGEIPRLQRPPLLRLRSENGERDPFVSRLLILLGIGLLILPVALTVRAGDDTNVLRSTTGAGAGAAALPGPPAPGAATATTVVMTTIAAPAGGVESESEAPVAIAPAAMAPAKPDCDLEYTVQYGDYWIGIAQRAKVELKELLAANNATAQTAIYPKREICLPAGATIPTLPTTTEAPSQPKVAAAPTTDVPVTANAGMAPTPKVNNTPASTVAESTSTTSTTTTTTLPPRVYTPAEIEQIIRDVWPDELEERALEIARRESNLEPYVRNFCCYGLFQIYFSVHRVWLGSVGVHGAVDLFDPLVNAQTALALYYRNGWGPWE